MNLKLLTIQILLSITLLSHAQMDSIALKENSFWNNKSISIGYQNGYIFQTNDFIKGNNVQAAKLDEFQAFSLKLSKQTNGEKLWEQLYKYPSWGLGAYVADFHNPAEIGTPIALYGFLNAPFVRWEHSTFNYEISFGATANWKSFNPLTNQYNIAIGAGQSFFIDAGLNLEFEISKHLNLVTGFSLTHFSNGALKYPNKGINCVAPKISLRYNLYERPKFIKQELPKFNSSNEWEISTFAGLKNLIFIDSVRKDIIEQYEGLSYPVFGVTALFNHQISRKSKIGLGINFAYNSTVNAESAAIIANSSTDFDPVSGPITDKIQISIFPSYELVVNKISLVLQPAFYIYRKKTKNQSPNFHQRIGLKYYFSDNFFGGIVLRDYSFHVSDFVEWTVGYRINGK
ncbi:MAG: acyloxyacyl hydrolase [Paludibacter sp.]|nr:acyloxyacyl hydrolase [Paludibacter sp.]